MSYLKSFEVFVQNTDVSRASLPEEEVEKPTITLNNTTETIVKSVANTNNSSCNKMEHSYTRESGNKQITSELTSGLAPARTILVRPVAHCASCNNPTSEEQDAKDGNQVPVPTYNEIAAKEAMNECARISKYVKNINSDDEDWEQRINRYAWSNLQRNLFAKVCVILDDDQLGRLANANRLNEPIQRRNVVDKSAARMRKALSSVAWDSRLTQWLHCLLMDYLPSTYMASYLDILQTLKTKLPALMDKMLFGRPLNVSQELLAPVMKKQWEPSINVNPRKLPANTVILIVPTYPSSAQLPGRLLKWHQHFANIAEVEQVNLPTGSSMRLPLHLIAEQIVSLTRLKIQELRNANPMKNIVLVGFNAGTSLALQTAMSECVSSVVCMGFAYNTLNGVRGKPDDRLLDIKVPILFVIGQNSARTSIEEIESLREKMQSETNLLVVGCGDDCLRVPKIRRKIESVTQSMIDTMIVDEVYDFIKYTIAHPPAPRVPNVYGAMLYNKPPKNILSGINSVATSDTGSNKPTQVRKRKQDNNNVDTDGVTPSKTKYVPHIGRPRTKPIPNTNTSGTALLPHNKTSSGGVGKIATQPKKGLAAVITGNADVTRVTLSTTFQPLIAEKDATGANADAENGIGSAKNVTNYELVPQTKMTPIKPTTVLTTLQKQAGSPEISTAASFGVAVPSGANPNTAAIGTTIKMIPSNKFIQLKPPMQSQSKIYTIKTASMLNTATGAVAAASNPSNIGSIVTTNASTSSLAPESLGTGQQQVFTLQSPSGQTTQFVASTTPTPQKYAVVNNTNSGVASMVQLSTNKSHPHIGSGGSEMTIKKSQMDLSNIIDMPIVFADNDGNLTDSVAQNATDAKVKESNSNPVFKPSTTKSGVNKLIISQQIIKEANTPTSSNTQPAGVSGKLINSGTIFINKPIVNMGNSSIISPSGHGLVKPAQTSGMTNLTPTSVTSSTAATVLNKGSKVIYINRNTMKPFTKIISRGSLPAQLPKYTNLVVTNPRISNTTTLVGRPANTISTNPTILPSVNLQALRPAGLVSTNSTDGKTMQQFQIIKSATPGNTAVSATTSATTTVGDKPQIRGIVVKPGLKQLPTQLKSQLINRSVTVRKLVNIGTVKKPMAPAASGPTANIITTPIKISSITTTKSPSSADSSGTMPISSGGTTSGIQTSPKIITLNPVNPSTPTTQKND